MSNGKLAEAENSLSKAIGANGYNQMVGTLNIAKGNYVQAESDLKGLNNNTAALAQLLNLNYDGALKTLDNIQNPDAISMYLHAIVAARNGNKFATSSYLQEAIKKDPSLKSYSDDDLELSILK